MHGSWCWERLTLLLKAKGHKVIAPDLPGSRNERAPADVTLQGYTDAVVDCLTPGRDRSILVGHSLGGIAVSCAAEAMPDRIHSIVYLCALLPRDGETPMDVLHLNPDPAVVQSFAFRPDGLSYDLPEADRRRVFYSDCAPADGEDACRRLVPQSVIPMTSPLRLTPERFGTVPLRYIKTLRDEALSPAFQQVMIGRYPRIPVSTLDTGHSPFLSAAPALSRNLARGAA
jgi:pimeloyl-ACP methyl ester carboxylesterase